jgi:hypothetical protein
MRVRKVVNKGILVPFLFSTIVTGVVCHEGIANAWWRRESGFECFLDTSNGFLSQSVGLVVSGPANFDSTKGALLDCPVLDDSNEQTNSIVTLNVEVIDNSTQFGIQSYACTQYWSVDGGNCGSGAQTGTTATGHFTLSPPLTYWSPTYSADFAFVQVILPQLRTGSNPSALAGIFYGT